MLPPFKPESSRYFFSKKITYYQKSNTNKFIHENFHHRLIYINGRHMEENEKTTLKSKSRKKENMKKYTSGK